MKLAKYTCLLVTAVIIASAGVGCKSPRRLTQIQGRSPRISEESPLPPDYGGITPGVANPSGTGIDGGNLGEGGLVDLGSRDEFDNMAQDPERFRNETVYFEFDRSVVRPGEIAKVRDVAAHMIGNPAHKLQIDGHCDERGTEGYNRSLGERRALAIREALARIGVGPERVRTLTWGEDRPADPGHTESAWSKNRRGEFILLTPRQ